MRRAISLIEVLMSIFIISIGLLGILALLPLAYHLANKGTTADRGAIAGQAALRDFKVRGMDHPELWRMADGSLPSPAARYCIDPRGVAAGLGGFSTGMSRLSLTDGTTGGRMGQQQADATFIFNDDLEFTVDATDKIVQTTDPDGSRFAKQEFSWFATLVREGTSEQYTISAVIVAGRHQPSPETAVAASITGGGEVRLTGDATMGVAIESLRQGHWIMLAQGSRARWYRILAMGEYEAPAFARDVTLAGPDWNAAGGYGTAACVIMPRVVAVYDRTVRLKSGVPW